MKSMRNAALLPVKLAIGALVCMLLGCATQTFTPPSVAAQPILRDLLNGTNLDLYIGTADTATTFTLAAGSYTTNRIYVNNNGSTNIPLATNSITGALVARPVKVAVTSPNQNADVNNNLAIAVTALPSQGDTPVYTNTATVFRIVRSSDGGTTWDTTGRDFQFTADISGGTTTLITNLNSTFLQGATHIQLYSVQTGANPPDGGIVRIRRISLIGWGQQ